MGDFRKQVIAAIGRLGEGQVASYGDIAAEAGFPGAARAVGAVLAHSDGLAWWRVVRADGRLAPGKEVEQALLLAAEGVPIGEGRVIVEARRAGARQRLDAPPVPEFSRRPSSGCPGARTV